MVERIFAGKKTHYKELVLKVLYEKGCLSAWYIAKEIAKFTIKPAENLTNKARNVQSRLIGKRRGLRNLVNDQFLKEVNGGYCLTFKGVCSASVLFSEHENPKPKIDFFSEIEHKFPMSAVNMQMLTNFVSVECQELHKQLRIITGNLLDKGLKFEKISDEQFFSFFDEEYRHFYQQGLSEVDGKSVQASWTLAVQGALESLLIKANELCLLQEKNFDDGVQNFELQRSKVDVVDGVDFEPGGSQGQDSPGSDEVSFERSLTFGQFLQVLRVMGRDMAANKYDIVLKILFGASRMEEIYNLSMSDVFDRIERVFACR